MNDSGLLVFSDLDGTLLDHHSYSFDAALPMIRQLDCLNIPLVPNTSKTKAELTEIRANLNNQHPFITENGAAVYIPVDYFKEQPEGTSLSEGYWVKGFALPRGEWQQVLSRTPDSLKKSFVSFYELGDEGIAKATGLTLDQAHLANQREYSEPLLWKGDEAEKALFKRWMTEAGYEVIEGGRFLHLTTGYTKGKAMLWLAECYKESYLKECRVVALGDGGNDVDMLERADMPVVVRPPEKPPITIKFSGEYITTQKIGPEGWNEAVISILQAEKLLNAC